MIQVKFKNLQKSDLVLAVARERVESLIDKFPDLAKSQIGLTLEMENSPLQAGPDRFNVKFRVSGGRYNGIQVSKADGNLYVAIADLVEHMLEKLNRFGDRSRVKRRAGARAFLRELKEPKSG